MADAFLSVQEALDRGSGEVRLRGWVYRERGSSKIRFLVLRDGSNIIQCVVKAEAVPPTVWEAAQKATIEASVELTGTLHKDPRAPTGFELDVADLRLVGESHTYPITKDQSTEFLLDQRHLWIRSRRLAAVMKVRHTVFAAFRKYFADRGFYESHMPIFTPTQCEGGSTVFPVKYFNDQVYLTQSWQLYAEAVVFALEKIFTIAPCFRAERSKTTRHLSEFWMAEMEEAWADLDGVVAHAEGVVCAMIGAILSDNRKELELLGANIAALEKVKPPFPRLTYEAALKLLAEKERLKIPWGKDLRTVEENTLMKHFDRPLVVTHYPLEAMAFYKPADPQNPKVALCFDMLAPGEYGELVGGSARETDINVLIERLTEQGEPLSNYQWYLDLRRFGSIPHAGFGLGMERVIAWVCGLDSIKDTIPFPRTMLRKSP